MQEKQLSENIERKIWDVNILTIFLVEDHPDTNTSRPSLKKDLEEHISLYY